MGEGEAMNGTLGCTESTQPDVAGPKNHDEDPFHRMIIRTTTGGRVQKKACLRLDGFARIYYCPAPPVLNDDSTDKSEEKNPHLRR